MALLERISEAITAYPRTTAASADGDVGLRLAEGAPVVLRGYLTPTDFTNQVIEGQQPHNTARATFRSLPAGVTTASLRNARYVWRGRTFLGVGEPEPFDALNSCRHWKVQLVEQVSP